MRQLGNLIAGITLALVGGSAIADDDTKWLPNRKLTPGAIAETRAAVICVHGYAKAHRIWHEKVATLVKYGIAPDQAFLFEDDDLVATLPAATRARTYAGAAALKAYRYPKGVSGNPSGMNRFYFQCRQIFQQASPELARAIVELALDPTVDERVRSVCLVAGLDRAGVKPMDYDPSLDQQAPLTWDPSKLTAEERADLRALLEKMVGKERP